MKRLGSAAAGAACVLAACLLAAPASAQTWDVPTFRTPYGESGYGLYLVLQNDVDDPGLVGTWRRAGPDVDLGLRGGLFDINGDLGLLLGVEIGSTFRRADDEFPLDVAWSSGAGIGLVPDADVTLLRIPIGVSLGRGVQLADNGTRMIPYVHPRLAIDVLWFDPPAPAGDQTDTSLHADIDLGLDIELSPDLLFRFALTLGHNEALGIGLAF